MAADTHGDLLRNPGLREIAARGTAETMEDFPAVLPRLLARRAAFLNATTFALGANHLCDTRSEAGSLPSLAKFADLPPVAAMKEKLGHLQHAVDFHLPRGFATFEDSGEFADQRNGTGFPVFRILAAQGEHIALHREARENAVRAARSLSFSFFKSASSMVVRTSAGALQIEHSPFPMREDITIFLSGWSSRRGQSPTCNTRHHACLWKR